MTVEHTLGEGKEHVTLKEPVGLPLGRGVLVECANVCEAEGGM